ncbi:hypothetical protein BDZ91DRAFT_794132 [Kalaharituber pfeilii]|nr:hypothetical protein BDZ91DRAFT_794132 [Kalaharituber pfeilii]
MNARKGELRAPWSATAMCPIPPSEPAHSEIPNAPTSPPSQPIIANSDFDSLSTLTAHTRAICATETPKSSRKKEAIVPVMTGALSPENAGDTRVRTRREASGSAAPVTDVSSSMYSITSKALPHENPRQTSQISNGYVPLQQFSILHFPHFREQDSNGTQAGKMERA